ncbi:hypothetical protein SCALM49S_01957 [Streptomyces californicus]
MAHLDPSGASAGFKLTETRSGRWIDLTRTSATRWSAKDSAERTVTYELSAEHGNLVRTTDTTGQTTAFGYDGDGRVVKVTSAEGRSTAFTYDAADRVTSMRRYAENGTGGSGPTYTYAYSAATPGEQGTTTVTDPLGHKTLYEHNTDGEMLKVTDPLGHARSSTYQNHLLQTATDAMGAGSGGGGTSPATAGTTATTPSRPNCPPERAPRHAGRRWPAPNAPVPPWYRRREDRLHLRHRRQHQDRRHHRHRRRQPVLRVQRGDPPLRWIPGTGVHRQRRQRQEDRVPLRRPGQPGERHTARPAGPHHLHLRRAGRTTSTTDGRGVKTTYTHDRRDRVTAVTATGSPEATYSYDGDGNLSRRTDPSGTQRYQFDALSRETIRTLQDGSQTVLAYTADGNVETYRDPGGTTAYQWDAANRLTQLTGPQGKKTSYAYDDNDRRTRTTYPGGTQQTQALDASGRPQDVRVIDPSGIT